MSAVRSPYRFAENAVGNTSNEYGNYILKRGVGEIRKPSWNRTETVVRLVPQWNFEANQWEPYRRSAAPMDFGDWIRRYDAVRGFGESGITMLLYDPVTNPAYDIQGNPCVVLYRAINAAIDNKTCEPDWPALLKGGNNRRAILPRHGHLYIARCGIFRIKSKDMATDERSPLGLASNDPAFFLELPKTAGERLISLLETPAENYSGDPDSPDAFKYGDIVSLDRGAYVHIFEDGADPRAANAAYQPGGAPRQLTVGTGGRGNYGSGGGQNFKGYDMFIEKEWKGYSSALNTPELEKLIKAKQRPWDDCLQFFSHQEQAFLIQDGFPASAILYAWKDHPDWIKDETRSKAVGRTSVAVDPRVQYSVDTFRQNPVVRPPAATAPATAETPAAEDQPVKVGGWGQAPAEPEVTDGRDSVVPGSLPDAEVTTPNSEVKPTTQSREDKARAALAAAKRRAATV